MTHLWILNYPFIFKIFVFPCSIELLFLYLFLCSKYSFHFWFLKMKFSLMSRWNLFFQCKLMAKEESLQVIRRTRSYPAFNNAIESTKPTESYKPTLHDLGFRQQPLSFEDLLSCFPGRSTQILELLRLLGPLNSPMFPILVYGGWIILTNYSIYIWIRWSYLLGKNL